MGAIGGDILEITFTHPTVGMGVIYPKAGEDSTIDTGGFRSSDDKQMIDGSGEMIDQMNRGRWELETVVSWDNNLSLELERMVALAGSPVKAVWTITHISGTVWTGKGKPVGDLKGNGNQGTFQLKLAGGGKLSKIL